MLIHFAAYRNTKSSQDAFASKYKHDSWICKQAVQVKKVFFAHLYSSWERLVNERHNGMIRAFIPKATSIKKYFAQQVLAFANEIERPPASGSDTELPRSFLTHF